MKSIYTLFFLICSISQSLFAENYLIYPNNQDQDITRYLNKNNKNHHFVFSDEEKVIISKLKADISNPIKVHFTAKELKKFKNTFPQAKIEFNRKLKLQSTEDEFYYKQWGLKNNKKDLDIKITDIDQRTISGVAGMDISYIPEVLNSNKTVVAIIDSGIDLNHPDLKDRIYQNKIECDAQKSYDLCLQQTSTPKICHDKWANFDGDNNGYPRDCHGYNLAAPKQDYQTLPGNNKVDDYLGHGTHVAGIIGAVKNKIGILGVSQNTYLLPVKVSGQENGNELGTDLFAKGLLYALNTPAKVVNLSFGWQLSEDSLLMRELIELAHTKKVLIVAAAGNSAHDTPTYPCAYQTVICVTAFSVDGNIASFANFGPSIDIAAPGEMILSTIPEHLRSYRFFNAKGYDYKSGTSMATPFVTAALARLINLNFDYQESKRQLLENTEKIDSKLIRFGRLNLKKSLLAAKKIQISPLTKDFLIYDYKNKKLEFNVQNLSSESQHININIKSNQKIKLAQDSFSFSSVKPNQIIKVKTSFIPLEKLTKPNIDLSLSINNHEKTYQRDYQIRFNAVNILNNETISQYFKKFPIINKTQLDLKTYLKNTFLRVIESEDPSLSNDYLIVKETNGRTQFLLLKQIAGQYILDSIPQIILGTDHIISKLSKIDLNGDLKPEYVLFLYLKKEDTYEVKFLTFSKNFTLLPESDFGLTVPKAGIIPSKFIWHDENDGYYPLWIQNSLDPSYETHVLPWDPKSINERKNRLFKLVNNTLEPITLPCTPIELFKNKSTDESKILCSEKQSFFYHYYYLTVNSLKNIKKVLINTQSYFSFEQSDTIKDLVTSELHYVKKEGRNLDIAVFHNNEYTHYKMTPPHFLNPINKLIGVMDQELGPSFIYTDDQYLYLTDPKLTSKLLKRANNKNNDLFYPLNHYFNKSQYLLYRPLNQSLGLSMDIITMDLSPNTSSSFYRDPEYQFTLTENFKEIGLEFASWSQKDTINLMDMENLSIFKLNLSKVLLED